jgi:hypothetical protein
LWTVSTDELVAQAVLERRPLRLGPARNEEDLLVLDVDALDGPDPPGEVEHLGLGERRHREPAAVRLPDHRRVEALLDRGPDREPGREVVALHDQVGAVAYAGLVDLAEQVVLRVAGEHVGEPGLHAHAHEREPPGGLPGARLGELLVAQLHARELVRPLGMRVGQRHRHVHVVDPGRMAGVEDGHHEPGIDRVEDVRDPVLADERDHRVHVRGVHAGAREPRVAGDLGHRVLHAGRVIVGDDHVLEEAAAGGDGNHRRADAAGADDEDPHCCHLIGAWHRQPRAGDD